MVEVGNGQLRSRVVAQSRGRARATLRPDHSSRSSPGRRVSLRRKPTSRDYFVLMPTYSRFDTTLGTLLETLRIRRVISTGIAGNIRVLFTANDAYMRELTIFAPADCIVSTTAADNGHALRQINIVLKGHVAESPRLTFRPARRAATVAHTQLGQESKP